MRLDSGLGSADRTREDREAEVWAAAGGWAILSDVIAMVVVVVVAAAAAAAARGE
jgi:hypothetical protein